MQQGQSITQAKLQSQSITQAKLQSRKSKHSTSCYQMGKAKLHKHHESNRRKNIHEAINEILKFKNTIINLPRQSHCNQICPPFCLSTNNQQKALISTAMQPELEQYAREG